MKAILTLMLLILPLSSALAQSATTPAGRLEACLEKDSPAIQDPAEWYDFCRTRYEVDVDKRPLVESFARQLQALSDKRVVNARKRAYLIRELAAIDALAPTPPDWFEANAPAVTTAPPQVREIVREVVQPVFLLPLPRFELPQIRPYIMQPYIMQPVRPPLNVTCTSYRYGTMIETRCQ